MERRIIRIASAVAGLPEINSTILDVGAGNGKLAAYILKIRPDLVIEGIDTISWPDQFIPIRVFDGTTIPAADGQWDYCMVSDVLHHCESPEPLLDEMSRVSRRGLIIKDHMANGIADNITLAVMDWLGNRGHGVHLAYNYWSSSEWTREFTRLRLRESQKVTELGLYPAPFSWFLDRDLHFVSLLHKEV